jgi:hypothetical protein
MLLFPTIDFSGLHFLFKIICRRFRLCREIFSVKIGFGLALQKDWTVITDKILLVFSQISLCSWYPTSLQRSCRRPNYKTRAERGCPSRSARSPAEQQPPPPAAAAVHITRPWQSGGCMARKKTRWLVSPPAPTTSPVRLFHREKK